MRSTDRSNGSAKCEITHRVNPRCARILRGVPENQPPTLRVECDEHLIASCRQLQTLLESAGTSPALRFTAPALHKALPLLATVAVGIEDLVQRVARLETTLSRHMGVEKVELHR